MFFETVYKCLALFFADFCLPYCNHSFVLTWCVCYTTTLFVIYAFCSKSFWYIINTKVNSALYSSRVGKLSSGLCRVAGRLYSIASSHMAGDAP